MTTSKHYDAYDDSTEHLLDELARVDLLLRRHLEAWWVEREGQVDEFRGLFVSDEEVDRLLAVPESPTTSEGTYDVHDVSGDEQASRTDLSIHIDQLALQIERRIEHSKVQGNPPRLATLADQFNLDRVAQDAILLALAPDLDRKYEKIYGYLQDDVTRTRPSVGLLAGVLAADERDRLEARNLFERGSTLIDERLLVIADAETALARPVRVPDRVSQYLREIDTLPASIDEVASVDEPAEALDDLEVNADRRDALTSLIEWLTQPDRNTTLVSLTGPDVATANAAVEALCEATGRNVLHVDATALVGPESEATIADLRREVRFRDVPVHVTKLGAITTETDRGLRPVEDDEPLGDETDPVDVLVTALDAVTGDLFLTGDTAVTARLQPRLDRHTIRHIHFPSPSAARRRRLWAAVDDLPPDVDPAVLASTYRLTRGQIEDALATARSLGDTELTAEAIREACCQHSTHGLDELAREVEPSYDWDDIVLPTDTLAHLREVAAHIRHRGTVFEEWGFEDKYSLGNGINVLFTGPSGTGKTMAAEIVAHDVGLPLYKLDLSAVMSKYIGETEKNLRRIFDAAEQANAILFFDEADAIFGERSKVSDSHDRYANVEVDYLLQRMEDHDGSVILASNLEENIDDAFLRRINLSVDFPLPERDARAEIWAGVFPDETPRDDLDIEFLASFELAGGNIKNVATTAAFMAAEADEDVTMAHIIPALRREFQKTGRLFDPKDFEPYREYLPDQ